MHSFASNQQFSKIYWASELQAGFKKKNIRLAQLIAILCTGSGFWGALVIGLDLRGCTSEQFSDLIQIFDFIRN